MIPSRVRRGARSERGAVAIIVAVSMVMLLVVTAMVLDFGLARLDRQRAKSTADSAVMAGLRAGDGGGDKLHTFLGVCGALQFLKANEAALSSLPLGSTCTAPDATIVCDPATASTHAAYTATVTAGGVTSQVTIKSPYEVSDGNYYEETYASLSGDPGTAGGCDQIGVMINQSRRPGLGSLATSSDLKLHIRSVGRVDIGDGDVAPALILLERTRCQVLTNGSSGPGNTSKIWVYGSGSTPSSIHSDSDASDAGCGSGPNQQLIAGNKASGIVALGAPTTGEPGLISTMATLVGRASNIVSDGMTNVYGTNATVDAALPGTKAVIQPRDRVGRLLADKHYLAGVTTSVRAAYSQWLLDHSSPVGYSTRVGCVPGGPAKAGYLASLAALLPGDSVYIDCPDPSGITIDSTIGAGRVYFHGFVKGGTIHMPNATEVYIDNTKDDGSKISADALSLSNGTRFCMRGVSCTDYSTNTCSSAETASSVHGRLFVRRGFLNSSDGSLLRLCNTTVYMLGGQLGLGTAAYPGGCLPTTNGTLPTTTPCTGATSPAGSGYLQLKGSTDWTAPNQYGDMSLPAPAGLGGDDALIQAAWDNGEDLALWDETYAVSPDFKMAGGAELNVSGVFFLPNAFPMTFSGGAVFDLRDAQFITRAFAVDGGAQLLMRVDPFNAITLPEIDEWTLVR